jgi:hypothetical protein
VSHVDVKTNLVLLLRQLIGHSHSNGIGLESLRGIANFDTRKDTLIKSLSEFDQVASRIRTLPNVSERYGAGTEQNLTLQLIYEYFGRSNDVSLNDGLVNSVWQDFVAELDSPIWLTRAVANMRYFSSERSIINLGDGLTIRGRNPQDLQALGFSKHIIERIFEDWGGFGSSSFVLVAEASTTKRPDNFLLNDMYHVSINIARAVGAMRLIETGGVGTDVIFVQRIARFNVGVGGISSSGVPPYTLGETYSWSDKLGEAFSGIYAALARLEKTGYSKFPGNLDLALRSFMSSYDRQPTQPDTQLVDAITALEALLGTETEIAFRLSYRVASLLADDEETRSAMFKRIKGFYDTRSKIVHGTRLKQKHSAYLHSVEEIRHIVRRLLRGFVAFTADDSATLPKGYFADELDASLLNTKTRDKLRALFRMTR